MQSMGGSKEIAPARTSSASGIALVTVLGLYLERAMRVEVADPGRPRRPRNTGDSAAGTRSAPPAAVLAAGKTIWAATPLWRSEDEWSWESHCRCSWKWADRDKNSSRSEVRGEDRK